MIKISELQCMRLLDTAFSVHNDSHRAQSHLRFDYAIRGFLCPRNGARAVKTRVFTESLHVGGDSVGVQASGKAAKRTNSAQTRALGDYFSFLSASTSGFWAGHPYLR